MGALIVKDLDSMTGTDILNLGSKPVSQIRKLSNKISEQIDRHTDKSDMVKEINNILDEIDCQELATIKSRDENKSLFKKIISFGKNSTDKILNKYKSITDNLNKLYREVESYNYELEEDNKIFRDIGKELINVQDDLNKLLIETKKVIETHIKELNDDSSLLDREKLSLLRQKVMDLEETLITTEKMQEDIKSAMRRNYALYIRVNNLYSTTLPSIQHHITNFRVYQEHNKTNELLKFMDEKKNELMRLSTDKSIELEKELYDELNSRDEQNLEVLKASLEKIRKSNEELQEKQQEYIESRIHTDYNLISADYNLSTGGGTK